MQLRGRLFNAGLALTLGGLIRDDPYWTSRKNSLDLKWISSINKVSLVKFSLTFTFLSLESESTLAHRQPSGRTVRFLEGTNTSVKTGAGLANVF
jgi:hypothetical protein